VVVTGISTASRVLATCASYNDVATEAGLSRIYAGQHTRIEIEVGSQLGQNVA
jgi:hypothetical protein